MQEVREALRRAATDTGGPHMAGKRVATAAAGKKRARSRKPSQESRRRQHEKPCRKCRRPGGVCDRRGPSTSLFPLSSDSSQSHSTRWSVPPVCWQTWVLSSPYVYGTRFVLTPRRFFVCPRFALGHDGHLPVTGADERQAETDSMLQPVCCPGAAPAAPSGQPGPSSTTTILGCFQAPSQTQVIQCAC